MEERGRNVEKRRAEERKDQQKKDWVKQDEERRDEERKGEKSKKDEARKDGKRGTSKGKTRNGVRGKEGRRKLNEFLGSSKNSDFEPKEKSRRRKDTKCKPYHRKTLYRFIGLIPTI
jgi:hypothetical protein